jgi:hypothetical protein
MRARPAHGGNLGNEHRRPRSIHQTDQRHRDEDEE